jgi:hypothetical protein
MRHSISAERSGLLAVSGVVSLWVTALAAPSLAAAIG